MSEVICELCRKPTGAVKLLDYIAFIICCPCSDDVLGRQKLSCTEILDKISEVAR